MPSSSQDRLPPPPPLLHAPGAASGDWSGLPVALTPLIGREVDVATTCEAMRSPTVRLVTLTGPGGVGKSRVAIQAAHELGEEFGEGVRLIRLAALDAPDLLLPAIARAVGLPDPGPERPVDALQGALAHRRLLLLLDSFDPILAAAPLLADLLRACPDLKALVTSRERLHLRGERVLRVSPLPTPSLEEERDPGALGHSPAVRLFVQQAREVVPAFGLDAENAAAVAGIVRRLDGLPLAIELAAARLALFSPGALLTRLERRLPLLGDGPADLPIRLRTLRAAIAWSYDLLTLTEQRLFRSLAVFAGGFTLEAVEGVTLRLGGGGGEEGRTSRAPAPPERSDTPFSPSTLDLIASLVDKSLLFQDRESGGEPRYAMLETVQEFGQEQLEALDEMAVVRQRHALWCLDLAERAADERMRERGFALWLDRLDLDHDDMRAALGWLAARDDDLFVRLAAALGWFWLHRSHRTEGRRWLIQAVARARREGLRTVAVARALDGAAVLAFTQGAYEEAAAHAAAYLTLSQELDDAWGAAAALNLLGVVARAAGAFAEAEEAFTQALARFGLQELEDWAALARLNLATVAFWQGDLARAETLGREALVVYSARDDAYGTAVALSDLALVASQGQDRALAAGLFLESLTLWQRVGTMEGLVDWLARVASLAATDKRPAPSVRLFGAVERAREAIGYTFEPPERLRQQQLLDAARAVLGKDAAATALQAGQEMPFAAAVAEASEFLATLRDAPLPTADRKAAPFGLTPRELEVLRLLAEGRSDRQIGEALAISHRTVMRHVEHILAKLDVDSRTAAATQAVRLNLI